MEKKERCRVIRELYEVIGELKSKDEVVRFLFGLFTPSELLMVSRRIQVAKMLINGLTYNEISKEIGASDQTIRKVEHWLKSDESRMKFIISKISKIKNKRDANIRNYESFVDRYPEHRFMKELFGL